MAEKDKDILENIGEQEYKYGFTSDIETETIGKGLSEDVVRLISAKKGEPAWMTERRVAAYRHWLTMEPPTWAHLTIPEIDFQDIIYYAAPKQQKNSIRWTRSTPNSNGRSTNWAFPSKSRWRWRAWRSMP